MGGVEDDEPPSKRVKASSRQELRGLSNREFLKELSSCSLSASMARPLASSQKDDEVIGSKGVKKVEFVRIIAEALYSLGYSKTGAYLEEESGIPFHSSKVTLFIQQILDGSWDESLASLHKIGIVDETIIKLACFIILQQKFFELLDGEKVMDALKTLRTEIAPLSINNIRVRELSSLILSPSHRVIDGISGQEMVKSKARSELLEDLQKLFPPTVMIPEKRLLQLVEQAVELQRDTCLFHNSLVGETSLLTDHRCGRDKIPSETVQILPQSEGEYQDSDYDPEQPEDEDQDSESDFEQHRPEYHQPPQPNLQQPVYQQQGFQPLPPYQQPQNPFTEEPPQYITQLFHGMQLGWASTNDRLDVVHNNMHCLNTNVQYLIQRMDWDGFPRTAEEAMGEQRRRRRRRHDGASGSGSGHGEASSSHQED